MKVGWVGVGAMGKKMARNVLESGFELSVFDVNASAVDEIVRLGGKRGDSPKDVAAGSDIVISMLPNANIVQEAMTGTNGVFAGARRGTIIVDMSSVAPKDTHRMAELAGKAGLVYLDAPVSGGVIGAEKGELTIMVGGADEAVEKVMPVFRALGGQIYHVGPPGSGDAVKLVNNLLLGVHMAAIAEAFVLGVKAGIEPGVLYDVLRNSSGASYALNAKVPNYILKRKFDPGFTINLQYKDLELATGTAKELGVPLFLGNIAQQMFENAKARGDGRKDISAVIQNLEKLVGVEVHSNSQADQDAL